MGRPTILRSRIFALARRSQVAGLKQGRGAEILREVVETVKNWPAYADSVGLSAGHRDAIAKNLRLSFEGSK